MTTAEETRENGQATVQIAPKDCLHNHVEVLDVVEDDPGPNEGWHDVKAECQDCGADLSCLIDWGAQQSDVKVFTDA